MKLKAVIERFRLGKIAPHVYRSDGASRDPECSVRGCKWTWSEHLDQELLDIVKEAAE